MKRHLRIYLIVGSSWTLSCGDNGTTAPPPPPPPPSGGAATVRTVGTTFEPANVTIAAGGTVTWTDTDATAHTVTSGQGSTAPNVGALFDQPLGDHASITHTFNV